MNPNFCGAEALSCQACIHSIPALSAHIGSPPGSMQVHPLVPSLMSAAPSLLVIDEVGYLSYSNRYADLLFELVSRRYQNKSTIVTTNRPFAEWREVFPNAACVVSLVDRLLHNAEIVAIEGESYRLKEARGRTDQRSRQRRGTKS